MRLPVVDAEIELCEEHLRAAGAFDTEIETFLVRYLLVLICGRYEETIESLVVRRAERAGDAQVTQFVKSAVDRMVRSPKTSDIAGLLDRFGEEEKDRFREKVKDTRAELSFNGIVANRHAIAHGGTVQMTFEDLRKDYSRSLAVLEECASALGVSPE